LLSCYVLAGGMVRVSYGTFEIANWN